MWADVVEGMRSGLGVWVGVVWLGWILLLFVVVVWGRLGGGGGSWWGGGCVLECSVCVWWGGVVGGGLGGGCGVGLEGGWLDGVVFVLVFGVLGLGEVCGVVGVCLGRLVLGGCGGGWWLLSWCFWGRAGLWCGGFVGLGGGGGGGGGGAELGGWLGFCARRFVDGGVGWFLGILGRVWFGGSSRAGGEGGVGGVGVGVVLGRVGGWGGGGVGVGGGSWVGRRVGGGGVVVGLVRGVGVSGGWGPGAGAGWGVGVWEDITEAGSDPASGRSSSSGEKSTWGLED